LLGKHYSDEQKISCTALKNNDILPGKTNPFALGMSSQRLQ